MRQVSESLAGRLAGLELSPFVLSEVGAGELDRLWLMGGYPEGGVLGDGRFPEWQRNYLRLMVERDLPTWGLPAKPAVTDRLLKMLAASHGQLWNASRVGAGLGLDGKTVNSYLDYLGGSFLLRRPPGFQASLSKRLTKSPKVYVRDSGVLHTLLQVDGLDRLLVQPWVGASWEGFVIEQTLGMLAADGVAVEAYHFRTSDGKGMDLLLEVRGERVAVEVKLTASPSLADLDRLDRVADLVGASCRYLVTRSPVHAGTDRRAMCDVTGLVERVRRVAG